MTHDHEVAGGTGTGIALVLLLAVAYEVMTLRQPPSHRWPHGRTAAFLSGCLALAAGLSGELYAGAVAPPDVPSAQRQGAATLMYYGGDIAELLVAAALVSNWRPVRRAASRAAAV